MTKNIIFDCSGVIKDALESQLWLVNRMFRKFGVGPITFKELKENWVQPYMAFYNKYLPRLTPAEEQKFYKEGILHRDCPAPKSFPDMTELIKKLKQKKFFLAIISSDFQETVWPEIENFKLENVFEAVVTDVDDKGVAIRDLVTKYNLEPGETFFIGDSNHEIEVGKQTGVKTVAVTWGLSTEERLKKMKPDFLARDLKELEKILL